ncbi:hypothetical protein A2755_00955 [Candidatus Wolfebacteria bacterium RIFCSPHIGHO2_01_FULL_48_22]|uniref:Coenzyme F420:L-glutamate ligase-like domain-containing protein n=2 Tax=Candidatus Wolfeibacteriota TaxID=1752735 RepID=A0A1F8DU34_9BACT|nr:MAG: hypothetical protein A2755_00955 [Candidatus Wolfebacteria bacterium RIFCSPHIGHO2_01_FULL_48_22]OGM93581.1 MAG: hypothetical protein A2935_03070 [Candidatus Wolfebacteria bacterium RIFCSPLOWO2_01_FULL_47_17b]
MQIIGIKTPIFKEKQSLLPFLIRHLPPLQEGDILAITSKIVSLSQGRAVSPKQKVALIKKDSKKIIETPWAQLVLTEDGWCINAGADESNANKKTILMPRNPFQVAKHIRMQLKKKFGLKKIGILITDTKSIPLRKGTMGRSVAYAGFEPLINYIGKKDLFGRKSRLTQSNVADALAASSVLVMGEGDEQTPLAVIRNASVRFTNKKNLARLPFSPKKDIYARVYRDIPFSTSR